VKGGKVMKMNSVTDEWLAPCMEAGPVVRFDREWLASGL
jgi:hypothetical protein